MRISSQERQPGWVKRSTCMIPILRDPAHRSLFRSSELGLFLADLHTACAVGYSSFALRGLYSFRPSRSHPSKIAKGGTVLSCLELTVYTSASTCMLDFDLDLCRLFQH